MKLETSLLPSICVLGFIENTIRAPYSTMANHRKDIFFLLTILMIVYTLFVLRNEIKLIKNVNNKYFYTRQRPIQNSENSSDFEKYHSKNGSVNSPIIMIENRKQNVRGQLSIPKIIHQIWNDEIIPGEFVNSVKSLVRDNPAPDWKYYWWTIESGQKLMKDKFPNLLAIVNGTSKLMRSDILRYLVIYEYGGVYFDLDTVSVKSLNNFVENHRCSLALEPAEHYFAAKGRDFLLTNAALSCIRRHPFFANLMLHIYKLPKKCRAAFTCTGPPMLSWFYREFNKTDLFAGGLPDVQISEIFQDVYDNGLQRRRLDYNCYNNTQLLPYQTQLCAKWIQRGKEKRNLSELALTYHTWFHIGTSKIMRSDILRYLVIYEYGGVYFDLDTVSVKSLNNFVENHRCSLALEPAEHYFTARRRDFLLTNAALLCIRRHPFFANLMLHIYKLPKNCKAAFACTGPPMLSWFYREFNKTDLFAGEVPDVQISEVFQDVYDNRGQRKRLDYNCYNNTQLLPYQTKLCANWVERGKEKRNLSELALTYHTWFHINNKKLKISNENHVKKVIPHALIYGKDF